MLLLSNRKFIIIIITALLVTGSGIVTQDLFAKTTFSKFCKDGAAVMMF